MEPEQTERKYKKQPRFYQDLLGGLLVAYSSSSESARYIIAPDILGYVRASLIFTKKIEKKYDGEKTYKDVIDEMYVKLQSAVSYWKAGDSTTSSPLLTDVIDTLKIIIMVESLVSEMWEHTSNPLGTSSVEHDRITSSLYRDINNVQ